MKEMKAVEVKLEVMAAVPEEVRARGREHRWGRRCWT